MVDFTGKTNKPFFLTIIEGRERRKVDIGKRKCLDDTEAIIYHFLKTIVWKITQRSP